LQDISIPLSYNLGTNLGFVLLNMQHMYIRVPSVV